MRLRAGFGLGLAAVALVLAVGECTSLAAGGFDVDVSSQPDAQDEPSIAVDPADDQILLAGSNSFREGSMRVYASGDGGATWASSFVYPPPASYLTTCASDPGVAIDANGRQYYSFVRTTPCRTGHPQLFVSARAGPAALWGPPALVNRLRTAISDDKPAIAVDSSGSSRYRGRIYVAWSRISRQGELSIVLSSSDTGGSTWKRLVRVSRTGSEETYASVAVAANGYVYVAWDDPTNFRLEIARSTDGGGHFGPEHTVENFTIVPIPSCGSGIVIPASLRVCLHANPIVSVDRSNGPRRGRVYVSYSRTDLGGDEGVYVKAFDSRLRVLNGDGTPVAPAPRRVRPDQFWPASAVDSSTGALWVCFYDTGGDPKRQQAFYTCSLSHDGARTWSRLVRAASVATDETQPGSDARQFGDYEGLAVANGVAHPIWTDSRELATLQEEIYTTRLTPADFALP